VEKNDKTNKKERVEKRKKTVHSITSVHPVNKLFIDKLCCMYTNADSLSNKMTELKTIVCLERPHVIAVTEVKPKNLETLQ
jgi:hypothetical protein